MIIYNYVDEGNNFFFLENELLLVSNFLFA